MKLLRHHKADIALVAAALAGAVIALRAYDRAYPTVTFEPALAPRAAVQRARDWLAVAGHDASGFRSAIAFWPDVWARRYFEARFNPEGAATWGMGICLDIWRWYVRLFKPGEEREFRVCLSPDGELVELYCGVPELARAPSMDRQHALDIAKAFVARYGRNQMRHYKLARHYRVAKPFRDDHGFVWERELRTLGHAKLEMKAVVSGGKVTQFRRGLVVPQTFKRAYAQRRAPWQAAAHMARQLTRLAAIIAGLACLCVASTRQHMRLAGLAVGAGAIALGLLLQALNASDATLLHYPTTSSCGLYMVVKLVGDLRSDALALLAAVLAGGCAACLWPARRGPAPQIVASPDARGVALAGLRGTLLGVAMLGVSTGLAVGCRGWLHARFAANLTLSNLLCQAAPAWGIATTLASRAFRNELVFRLFALALLCRVVRFRALAVLLASLLWGVCSLDGSASPPIANLLFGASAGLMLSLAVMRYDALTAMAASYVCAALPMSLPLFHAGDAYSIANAVVALVLPLAPMVLLLRGREKAL